MESWRQRTNRKRIAHDESLPVEKWLAAFRNPSKKGHGGNTFVRQFYAPGFYEAYDTVVTYAEKSKLEVLWFKEKRSCEPFVNSNFPEIESFCTYCNKKFNHSEPVPCIKDGCYAEFCSMECMTDHCKIRHKT